MQTAKRWFVRGCVGLVLAWMAVVVINAAMLLGR
jgi:hypothetical protein